MYKVLIRPLRFEDASVSWKWRNDPEVWRFTGSCPNREITYEIEKQWIEKVLKDNTCRRFAIMADKHYIGNIQLTNIRNSQAEYHIFIGDKNWWNKGISGLATFQILYFAKEVLGLKKIYLSVRKENKAALKSYQRSLFRQVSEEDNWINMECCLESLPVPMVSVFMMAYNHEKFISEAIEGVLMQKTNFDFEIVIGEDFSKDNTRQIILDYQQKYPGKFKLLLHKKNIGAVENQMAVFKACTGKYIALCEGDDYWTDPLKLQKQVDFLEANKKASAVGTYRYELKPDGTKIANRYKSKITKKDVLSGMIPGTQTLMLVNYPDLCSFLNQFPEFYSGDRLISYFLSTKSDIFIIPEYTAVYRVTGEGVWSKLSATERSNIYVNSFVRFHEELNFPDIKLFRKVLVQKQLYVFWKDKNLNITQIKEVASQWKKYTQMLDWIFGAISFYFNLIIGKFKSTIGYENRN